MGDAADQLAVLDSDDLAAFFGKDTRCANALTPAVEGR
jgi:hypothetical protein